MKQILQILVLFPVIIFGQKDYKFSYKQGYDFIKKAEKQIAKNNFDNAQKLVIKAKKSNFGFCGNSWAEANSKINLIESKILNSNRKYDESLKLLESIDQCGFGAYCAQRDYLKIETLFLKFGKEKVKNAFKNTNQISKNETEKYEDSYSVYIKEIDYNFNFLDEKIQFLDKDGKVIKKAKQENPFLNIAQNQMFNELLE